MSIFKGFLKAKIRQPWEIPTIYVGNAHLKKIKQTARQLPGRPKYHNTKTVI
jgi:hypothetical protein